MTFPRINVPAVAFGMLAAAIVVSLLTFHSTTVLRRELTTMVEEMHEPTKFETEWQDADGLTHRVTTTRLDGETAAEHATRHAESVAALKAQFPPAG